MKLIVALATAVALTQTSFAQECWLGQESQLSAVDWSATKNEEGWTKVSIIMKNSFAKDLKSAIARAVFSSAKGAFDEGVGGPIVPQHIAAGKTRTIEFSTDAVEYTQLIGAKKDDFGLQICLQSVSFAYGTEERFLSPLSNQ